MIIFTSYLDNETLPAAGCSGVYFLVFKFWIITLLSTTAIQVMVYGEEGKKTQTSSDIIIQSCSEYFYVTTDASD